MRPTTLALAILVLAASLSSALAQDKDTAKVGLTDSIFPGMTGKKLRDSARPFRSLVESSTGLTGEIATGGSAADLADKLKKNDLQLGVFTGVEFAWAKERNPKLEPVAICVNQKRTVTAVVLVRSNSKLKSVSDLRGTILAQPEEVRSHVQILLDRKVVPETSTAKKFFKKVRETKDVEEALDDVVDGQAQVAVVDSLAFSSYQKAKPGAAAKLRTLLSSGAMPCTVLACQSGHYSSAKLRQIREGLIGSKDTKRGRGLLQQLRLTGFEAVPSDFEEQLSSASKAFPAPKAK